MIGRGSRKGSNQRTKSIAIRKFRQSVRCRVHLTRKWYHALKVRRSIRSKLVGTSTMIIIAKQSVGLTSIMKGWFCKPTEESYNADIWELRVEIAPAAHADVIILTDEITEVIENRKNHSATNSQRLASKLAHTWDWGAGWQSGRVIIATTANKCGGWFGERSCEGETKKGK